jgi:poly(A) polymerase
LKARGPVLSGDVARFLRSRGGLGYLVGGAVRDALLEDGPGLIGDNLDLAVEGVEPVEVAKFLHARFGFTRPVAFRRSDTVFTGDGRVEVEICPLRGSLEEDARRRDFTVNSLYVKLPSAAVRVTEANVIDPTGSGLADLEAGILRTCLDPYTPFAEDPARLLRAVRFRATLGFRIDESVKAAMGRMAFLVSRVAAERARDELEKIVLSRRLVSSFRLMHRLGLLAILLPDLAETAGFDQGSPYHAYDLLTHTLKTAARTRPDLRLRLAALFHDAGKMKARRRRGDRVVYYGHEKISARRARSVLEDLRFPMRLINDVVFLIENHMVNYSESWTDAAVRRFMRKMGGRLGLVLELARADRSAHAPDARMGASVSDLRKRIQRVEASMKSKRISFRPPLDGHRIMGILGIEQGPDVGRAKEYLYRVMLERGEPIPSGEAEHLLKKWATSRKIKQSK